MLPTRIVNFLNAGHEVVAQVPSLGVDETSYVRIRPIAKPGVPREERRYLNSIWSIWEYWDFEFRRFVLRSGWRLEEWDYDRYIVEDQREVTHEAVAFEETLRRWVPDVQDFKHVAESDSPE